jgi:hypothetical protein
MCLLEEVGASGALEVRLFAIFDLNGFLKVKTLQF